ncbi:MAG: DUF1616 domain-containing protein [Chloroflexi bacterium]|nr:DUF1616 domain-containing protein [Chloroflexota bacterium]
MESKKTIRITARVELISVISFVALLALSIAVPWIVPRVVLGILFVLFVPGYTLLSTLFPRKKPLDLLERLVISAGFSLIVVSLIAFVMNFTPWGLRLAPLFIGFSAFAVGMTLASYLVRRRIPEGERFEIVIPVKLPVWEGANRWSKALSLTLLASIVIAVGSIGFAIARPKAGEKFTEFYVLGSQGKAADYPQMIKMGETVSIKVGVINREQRPVAYRLEVLIGGARAVSRGPITLDDGETWEEDIPLKPTRAGQQQKVELNLYRPEDVQPYEFLILWVDVPEAGVSLPG